MEVNGLHIAYRLFRFPEALNARRLLCLHGAGVAGELTYGYLIPHLTHWSEILVPDFQGMGETYWADNAERSFSVVQLMSDTSALLAHLQWQQFDLCGYSLGGLVAMLLKQQIPQKILNTYLIEPALLDHRDIAKTRAFREQYKGVADKIRTQGDRDSVMGFLDLVSPDRVRNERADALVASRLGHRPYGFANALDAVSRAADEINRMDLLQAQANVTSFVGGKSYLAMRQLHQELSATRADWRYVEIPGADHSLPFQKPKRLAEEMMATELINPSL
ncbi:MAG: alpha/beta hydrolase [Oceanospirillaceae bacterium]|nr:alpha/beta hydrolase [Oceanospirillaceae bacterium]